MLALAVTVGIAASVRVSAEWAVVTNNLYALSHLTCLSLSLCVIIALSGSSPGCYGAYPALPSVTTKTKGKGERGRE